MGVRDDYKKANLINDKEKFTMLAMLGFIGLGGMHRFLIALRTKDEQQAFLGGIYLLPSILVGLLVLLSDTGFKLWYLAPLVITYILTLHDLTSMDRLLSGELSAKKAWYETWPGRVGAVILLPIGLYFLYKKTDLPQKQKNAIAGTLVGALALFLGASFTGIEELTDAVDSPSTSENQDANNSERRNASEEGLYETCDEARAAGVETPIEADSELYATWLDRDLDGLACE